MSKTYRYKDAFRNGICAICTRRFNRIRKGKRTTTELTTKHGDKDEESNKDEESDVLLSDIGDDDDDDDDEEEEDVDDNDTSSSDESSDSNACLGCGALAADEIAAKSKFKSGLGPRGLCETCDEQHPPTPSSSSAVDSYSPTRGNGGHTMKLPVRVDSASIVGRPPSATASSHGRATKKPKSPPQMSRKRGPAARRSASRDVAIKRQRSISPDPKFVGANGELDLQLMWEDARRKVERALVNAHRVGRALERRRRAMRTRLTQ
jgi:hypothetical protein